MKNPFEGMGDKLSKSAKIMTLGLGLTAASQRVEAKSMDMASADAKEIKMEKGDIGWATAAYEQAKQDAANVKTAEDAEWFLKSCRKIFQEQLGMPAVDVEASHNYATQEYVDLLVIATKMDMLMESVVQKFSSEDASLSKINLDYTINYLKQKTSVSGQKQTELLKNADFR